MSHIDFETYFYKTYVLRWRCSNIVEFSGLINLLYSSGVSSTRLKNV